MHERVRLPPELAVPHSLPTDVSRGLACDGCSGGRELIPSAQHHLLELRLDNQRLGIVGVAPRAVKQKFGRRHTVRRPQRYLLRKLKRSLLYSSSRRTVV